MSDHAYHEAPPASGKTLALVMVADGLPHDTAYYPAHTVDLVDQARRKICGYQSASIVGDDTIWRFMTRAACNNMVRREAFKDAPAHVAFVDECHMGGVASRQPKVSSPASSPPRTRWSGYTRRPGR